MKIFTGAVPFGNCPLVTSVTHIIQGKRPPRSPNPILTDDLWALTQRCWDQQPQLRPQMAEILKAVPGSVSEKFRRIHEFSESSPEFRLALDRLYGSIKSEDYITHLHGTALEEFINFLGGVSRQTFPTFAMLNMGFVRCYTIRD